MRGATCHAAAASKDAAVVYARRHAPSVSCPLGSIQSLHGITCHVAGAQKGAASEPSATLRAADVRKNAVVELSAAQRAVRTLPSRGQRSMTAWRQVPRHSCLQERGCGAMRGITCRASIECSR